MSICSILINRKAHLVLRPQLVDDDGDAHVEEVGVRAGVHVLEALRGRERGPDVLGGGAGEVLLELVSVGRHVAVHLAGHAQA